MGPELGHRLQLGLASMSRLARAGGPELPGGCGTLGTHALLGAAAATATPVGARGQADVESDWRRQLGFLEQRDLDSGLTRGRTAVGEA